jgi:hypothetical protein
VACIFGAILYALYAKGDVSVSLSLRRGIEFTIDAKEKTNGGAPKQPQQRDDGDRRTPAEHMPDR